MVAVEERMKRATQLIRAGVGVLDADRLLAACESDRELALVLVPLNGSPREGDRIRVKLPSGPRSLRIEMVMPANPLRTGDKLTPQWAIVGRPVAASRRDDVSTSAPVRRGR